MAESDDAGPSESALTLDTAVRLAVEHDPGIQSAAARVRAALADAGQARLLPNPVLNVALRFPEGGGKPTIEASLSEELLSILTRPWRVSAADHRVRTASAEALETAVNVVIEAQEHYAAVQALEQRVGVLRDRHVLVNRLLDVARVRLQAGEAGRLDVITLDAERAALESDLIERTGELRDRRLALARMIGRPSDAAGWSVTPWQPSNGPMANEMAWVEAALRHRPEVQARRWELAALGDEAAIAGWGIFDGAGAGVSSERDSNWANGPAVSSVPLPLFDWGQARRERAEAQRVEGRHKLTQVRRQVIEDVRRAYAAVTSSRAAVAKVRDELAPLQAQRLEQATAAYKAGAADITAVLVAEQQSQEVRERLAGLEQNLATATFRLQRAVGGAGIAAAATGTDAPPATAATRPVASRTEHQDTNQ